MITFFTPVSFGDTPKSTAQSLLEITDSYFYLGGKKAEVVSGHYTGNAQGVRLVEADSSLLATVAKIASYFTVVLPVLILAAKAVLRITHDFYVIQEGLGLTIVDAKDSGMSWVDVRSAIRTISGKELKNDEGMISAEMHVQEEYFTNKTIAPGMASPETIILAKMAQNVIGFIITAKLEEGDEDDGLWTIPFDTGYVSYLAVDSTAKREGVGTKLMLAAMRKTQEIGKRYLKLEYIAEDRSVDKMRGKAKVGFYNSFTTRFGIPMKEKGNFWASCQRHVFTYYDLKDIDFSRLTV